MNKLLILLLPVFLSACLHQAESPRDVARQYWLALKNGDTETARNLVSKDSRHILNDYLAKPADEKTPIGEISLGAEQTTVVTLIYPRDDNPDDYSAFDTTLVMEDGEWKVDAAQTVIPRPAPSDRELEELADQLSESVEENIESIEEAMKEGMDMLDEAMREGSRDLGESMLKAMEEMNRALRKSIDDMQERREKQQTDPKKDGGGLI